jgi:hypothetical protein
MRSKRYLRLILLAAIAVLGACAPYDLDITPSATPTPVPTPTPTPDPAEIEAEAAVVDIGLVESLLGQILEAVPGTIPAGATQWQQDGTREPEDVRNVTNGIARRVFFTEQQGGRANLTFGVFNSPEDAENHYEFISGIRSALERGQPDDNFPEPNLFGSGLYGSNAIFQSDNIFVEVSVELFSSTAGNPLPGLARSALSTVERGLESFEAAAAETGAEADTDADPHQARLAAILAAAPASIVTGTLQWRLDTGTEPENVRNVTNGIANRIYYTEPGGSRFNMVFGVFDTAEDAQNHFEFIAGLRTQLENANELEDLPSPNLFRIGLYGSVGIVRIDDVFVEVFIEQVSGATENPLTRLAGAAVRAVEQAENDNGGG